MKTVEKINFSEKNNRIRKEGVSMQVFIVSQKQKCEIILR